MEESSKNLIFYYWKWPHIRYNKNVNVFHYCWDSLLLTMEVVFSQEQSLSCWCLSTVLASKFGKPMLFCLQFVHISSVTLLMFIFPKKVSKMLPLMWFKSFRSIFNANIVRLMSYWLQQDWLVLFIRILLVRYQEIRWNKLLSPAGYK